MSGMPEDLDSRPRIQVGDQVFLDATPEERAAVAKKAAHNHMSWADLFDQLARHA